MDSRQSLTTPADIEQVIITSQLQQRIPRVHDLKKENDAFRELANQLATSPEGILDRLVEFTLDLCSADTAGISLEETNDKGERIFRWIAMAGELKHLIGGTNLCSWLTSEVCMDI